MRFGIAAVQLECVVGQPEHNVDATLRLARRAAEDGARLVVLPELCTSGYVLADRAEAYRLSEPVPGGPASRAYTELCRQTGVYLVAGIAEREGVDVYNSAVLFGPEGYVGTYRKLHLWNRENLLFEPGDLGVGVFHTHIGRIGLAVCYDGWFPELFRACASRGADVIALPTNWVPGPADSGGGRPVGGTLAIASAVCNGVVIAAADRVGIEREQRFLGTSVLVGARGELLAEAGPDEEEIVHAEVDLAEVRAARSWSPYNHLLHDRRGDVYGEVR